MKTQLFFSAIIISMLITFSGKVNAKEVLRPNENSLASPKIEQLEFESDLQIENWMVNEDLWNKSEFLFNLPETPEADLTIEDWMHSDSFFKINKQTENEDSADRLTLESWMTDNNIWRL